MITTLLPLLHLVQDSRLSIFQEKFLGEIFIRVREKSQKEKEEKTEEYDGEKGEEEAEEKEAEDLEKVILTSPS